MRWFFIIILIVKSINQIIQCPEDFTKAEKFCYKLTPKEPFLPPCPLSKPLPFDQIQKTITKLLETVWVPVKRNKDGFFRWIEPGKNYGAIFNKTYMDGDCLIYQKHSFRAVACTDQYLRLCAYEKLDETPNGVVPKLTLSFSDGSFKVGVSEAQALASFSNISIFCFTDHYRWTFPHSTVITFEPITTSGYYWCEAFHKSNFNRIKSPVLFHETNILDEYVGTFLVNGDFDISNIQSTIPYVEAYYRVQLVKLWYSDSNNIWLNVHFTRHKPTDHRQGYDFLYQSLETYFKHVKKSTITFISLLNSKHCLPHTDLELTWPKTQIGLNSYPVEYCFWPNGTRAYRSCGGSRDDGAQWSPFTAQCELAPTSFFSHSLETITKSNTIVAISGQYQHLKPLDVFLLAEFYNRVDFGNSVKLYDDFFQVVDNVLAIDWWLLHEAQHKMMATDYFLAILDRIIRYETNESYQFVGKNMVFVTNSNGILLRRNRHVSILRQNITLRDVVVGYDLELAIIASSPMNLLLYHTNGFFDETQSRVVSVQFSDTEVVLLQRAKAQNCSFWDFKFGFKLGAWHSLKPVHNLWSHTICTFLKSGNLAMTGEPDITSHLDDILNTNLTFVEIMQQLSNVTEYFEDFKSSDVTLVAKILAKIAASSQIDLSLLTQTVNNILQIGEDTLLDSQETDLSTDRILLNIDNLLKNSEQGQYYKHDEDFLIFITDQSDFLGIVITKDDIQILQTSDSFEQYLNNNLIAAIILTKKLREQLQENTTKIIITVYFKSSFFQHQNSSVVFGAILPDFEFASPLSLFYGINVSQSACKCVHWSYDPIRNKSGFWKDDTKAQQNEQVFRCDFWHTTHLALLLLDPEPLGDVILQWINLVAVILSWIGFTGIFSTAILFRKWRQNTGNQILLNLILSIVIEDIITMLANFPAIFLKRNVCIILGALLHYAFLSQFSWMCVIAILQFKKFVLVFGTTGRYLLIKACCIGWGLPLIPVVCVVITSQDSYKPNISGFCYPGDGAEFWGVWLPIGLAVTFNLALFVYIMYSICTVKSECATGNQVMHQWRLAVVLFFLLGITWVFGLFANLNVDYVFVYLFAGSVNLTGFVIFMYFIVFNKNTRSLYVDLFKNIYRCGQ